MTRRRLSGSGSRCAAISASSSAQLDVSTVFVREWRYLTGERLERFVAERRRYEERIRELYADGLERSELRADLDVSAAALLFLSAANWAYTWLRAGSDTDALADRFAAVLHDGMRGYVDATPRLTRVDGATPGPQRVAYARGRAARGSDRESVLDQGDR